MQKTPDQSTESIEALLEPGTTEPRLNEFLTEEADFSDGIIVPPLQDKRCHLCTITDYPYSQREIIFEQNKVFYIVETADKKGHERRNMLVLNEHNILPGDQEMERYAAEGLKSLVNYTYDGSGPVVVYAGNTTFHHPHILASDTDPHDTKEAKLDEVSNYLVFDGPDNLTEPLHEEYGNIVGEAFLKRFYESAMEEALNV